MSDIFSINEKILILKIISQCVVKYIIMSLMKSITSILKVLKYIVTSITAFPTGLAVMLVIIAVMTFKTVVILYVHVD